MKYLLILLTCVSCNSPTSERLKDPNSIKVIEVNGECFVVVGFIVYGGSSVAIAPVRCASTPTSAATQ